MASKLMYREIFKYKNERRDTCGDITLKDHQLRDKSSSTCNFFRSVLLEKFVMLNKW